MWSWPKSSCYLVEWVYFFVLDYLLTRLMSIRKSIPRVKLHTCTSGASLRVCVDSFVCRDIRQMSDTETTLERLNNKLVVLSPLYHLRQRVYVFARSVCLLVYWLVSRITQKLLKGFSWNSAPGLTPFIFGVDLRKLVNSVHKICNEVSLFQTSLGYMKMLPGNISSVSSAPIVCDSAHKSHFIKWSHNWRTVT